MYNLDITPEVQTALDGNKPVVALESTIITHGMPWPQNYDMANQVEDMVRAHCATPATIAVIDGRIKIGLDQNALKTLAQTQGARKLSRADLAICLVDGATGATTVAATMILAHLAGVHVFATGGIGGVHRSAEHSFDISADLQELAQTPVTVDCRRGQGNFGYSQNVRGFGNLGRACYRLWTGCITCLLVAHQRFECPSSYGCPRADCAGSENAHLAWANGGAIGGQSYPTTRPKFHKSRSNPLFVRPLMKPRRKACPPRLSHHFCYSAFLN